MWSGDANFSAVLSQALLRQTLVQVGLDFIDKGIDPALIVQQREISRVQIRAARPKRFKGMQPKRS
jgi:hypothetical protein